IKFPEDWRDRMAEFASGRYEGPSLSSLNERRRRLARAYADGAYSDVEYSDLRTAVDEQFRAATRAVGASYEEAAAVLRDMPAVWERARAEERRVLLGPLIERIYVDVECGLIGGLAPTSAFRDLIDHALRRSDTTRVVLLTSSETRQIM